MATGMPAGEAVIASHMETQVFVCLAVAGVSVSTSEVFRGCPRQKSGKDRSGESAFCKLYGESA
jgi:hypothetical protein